MQETTLTAAELKSAKALLKTSGFIKITREGLPCKTFYDFDIEKLEQALIDFSQTSLVKSAKLDRRNSPNSFGEINQTALVKSAKHYTENTTENTKTAAAPKNGATARAQAKPKKPRQRDPIFDAIAECSFGIPIGAEVANDTGARIGKVKREVLTTFPALTAEQLRAAYGWHTNTENLTAPCDPAKVVTMVGVYQSKHPSRSGSAPTFTPRPDCKQCGGTGLVLPALGAYEDGDPRANTPIQCPVCVKAARASEAQREAVGP